MNEVTTQTLLHYYSQKVVNYEMAHPSIPTASKHHGAEIGFRSKLIGGLRNTVSTPTIERTRNALKESSSLTSRYAVASNHWYILYAFLAVFFYSYCSKPRVHFN